MPSGVLRRVFSVVHLGWEDDCQLVLDVDAKLGRKLRDVDPEDSTQLSERIVEHPPWCPRHPWLQSHRTVSKAVGG